MTITSPPKRAQSVLDLIGNTPIVPIRKLNPFKKVTIFAKLESFNPGGSVKDRIALNMIEDAEASGELTPDRIVLEATSGNTGIGLAMVCAVKGYRCQLVMPESASIERRKIMIGYGAEILLTPAKRATDGAIEQAYALAREHPERYFLTDQFNNDSNWQTHFKYTGPEIWQQTEGKVTDVVATLGTTGTGMGICRYFAEHHPEVKVTAMEPFLGHKIQGLKNMKESYKPGIFRRNEPFQIINVPDEEAFAKARQLAAREGIFVGMSSGAAMCTALARAEQLKDEGGVIVVIFPDGGEKYLSTQLFSAETSAPPSEVVSRLRFHNTLSKRKEVFEPINPGQVTFYTCGPTAHELATLDHCRRFIHSDLLNRLLQAKGYAVKFYMNFTDLDDNTIRGAQEGRESVKDFTSRFIEEFKADMAALGVLPATGYPRASEHVERMLDMSRELVKRGYAYEKHGSIYFDISKFAGYGRLSGVDLGKIRHGRTVDLDDYEKDSPGDFTLLKRSALTELKGGIFYATEWGNMRPGWHIECAAMSCHFLGDTIDIHSSSRDLIFPHHENEIAIAEALSGKPLAKYWLHSELVLAEGKKMNREAGTLLTLRDLLAKGFSAREVRYFLLRTHYRKPINYSPRKLEAALTSLNRLDEFCAKLLCLQPDLPHPEVASFLSELERRFFAALDDDLNVSSSFGALFDFVKKVNPIVSKGQLDRDQKNYILETLRRINTILNVLRLDRCPLAPEIDRLILDRETARRDGDWARADGVRSQLASQGIEVIDTVKGTVWKEKR
ncbi:MAG: cysteine--tRNA ligase [Desulfobulbaceae bacterium]|nr:cysteine--tRNA ligase [Desulfobulbaceae bacterium]